MFLTEGNRICKINGGNEQTDAKDSGSMQRNHKQMKVGAQRLKG